MKITRLSKNSVLRNLKSLEEKLSIDTLAPEDSAQRKGKLYRVWGYKSILERRQTAGLKWFIKSRAGVTLLANPTTTDTVPSMGTVPIKGTVPSVGTVPMESMGSVPSVGRVSVPSVGTPLEKNLEKTKKTTTTDVRARLQAELPTFDDAAVEQLWTECRKRVPDVTAEEVAALFTAKLPASRVRLIESPNGFLLRAVAQSCTAAAVAAMRQGRESPVATGPLLDDDELRSLLEDPGTPANVRQQIAQRLENT